MNGYHHYPIWWRSLRLGQRGTCYLAKRIMTTEAFAIADEAWRFRIAHARAEKKEFDSRDR